MVLRVGCIYPGYRCRDFVMTGGSCGRDDVGVWCRSSANRPRMDLPRLVGFGFPEKQSRLYVVRRARLGIGQTLQGLHSDTNLRRHADNRVYESLVDFQVPFILR